MSAREGSVGGQRGARQPSADGGTPEVTTPPDNNTAQPGPDGGTAPSRSAGGAASAQPDSDIRVDGGDAAVLGSGEPEPEPVRARQPWVGWQPLIVVAGVVIAALAALISGVLELFLTTLRAGDLVTVWSGEPIGSGGGPVVGLSIVLAGVLNIGIAWFAVSTTGRRWALAPPWVLWTLLMLFAASVRTHEGDYLLSQSNWVALVTILVGSLTYALFSYRMILKRDSAPRSSTR